MATELLIYAHGTPDLPLTMDEIADISERTVGDKQIAVAYDDESSWPLEWYMREYPNRVFYGSTPTRDKLNVPIVIYGIANESKVKPYLGDDYNCFKRRLRWWPNQQYFGLTLERVWEIVSTPEQRENEVFGDPLQLLWKNCIFDLCGVPAFYRKMYRVIVTSTVVERQAWLADVRATVFHYFPDKKALS